MNETPRRCPRCGTEMEERDRPLGLCPACLLFLSAGGAEEPESGPAPSVAELAPHFPGLVIEERIGRGGMGVVYRARQKSLDRLVALKVLTLGADDGVFAERFAREARSLAALHHENLVQVHDTGRAGPYPFLIMELVEGVSLRQMIRARTASPAQALAIVAQVCDALQYAHEHGVVHRDIKPENILVDRRGRAKVLDFGLAKLLGVAPVAGALTRTDQAMGTPHYMAPEQWERPLEVDHRADIYSVGVVFYELLTGELPLGRFAAPSQRVAVDVRLDEVVLKTLEKEPDRRYQQASAVKVDVDRIATTPPPVAVAAGGRGGRKVWPWVVLALFLVPIGLGALATCGWVFLGARMQTAQQTATDVERAADAHAAAVDRVRAGLRSPDATGAVPVSRFEFEQRHAELLDAQRGRRVVHELDPEDHPFTRANPDLALYPAEHLAAASEHARTVWRDYLALEARHTAFADGPGGRRLVLIEAFPEDRALTLALWSQRMAELALDPSERAAFVAAFDGGRRVYGAEPVAIELWEERGRLRVEEYTYAGAATHARSHTTDEPHHPMWRFLRMRLE